MVGIGAELVFLAVVALGAGALVLPAQQGERLSLTTLSLRVLIGLAGLAALMNALGVFGLPRTAVLGIAVAGSAAGFLRLRGIRVACDRSLGLEVGAGLLILGLLASPLLLALGGDAMTHDAVTIWWPKAQEVANGEPPDLSESHFLEAHPEYPRGQAWLVNLASPWRHPSPRLLRLVSVLFAFTMAMAMVDLGRRLARPAWGILAAAIALLLPEVGCYAASGMVDVPLSALVVAVGFGLTVARRSAAGLAIAATGAVGAAALKDEGAVIGACVSVMLVVDLVRHRAPRRLALPALIMLIGAPWFFWRRGEPVAASYLLQASCFEPSFLLARLDVLPGLLVDYLCDRTAFFVPGRGTWPFRAHDPLFAGGVVLLAGLVLIPRGRRPVVVLPAGLLLIAHFLAVALTPWTLIPQVNFAVDRLLMQVVPLLVLGAVLRLGGGDEDPGQSEAGGSSAPHPEPAAPRDPDDVAADQRG